MDDLIAELDQIPKNEELQQDLETLINIWRSRDIGLEGVEAILTFIETNPMLDYGQPGSLVHFAEEFYRRGYEAALLRSIARSPTPLTAWMLKRVINGTKNVGERELYVAALERAKADPATDEDTQSEIAYFLDNLV